MSTPVGADPAIVGPYLASVFGDEKWQRVGVELIAAGMSNLTYVVTPASGSDDDAVILRRPPTGAVLATAHDMAREHRVITALGPTAVPVPRTLHLCTDPAVLGAPFYVMERVVGVHVVRDLPAGYADEPAQRTAIADGLIDVLADLHAVDVAEVGLSDFGRPEGFMARQVRRWTTQWEATRDRERPGLDALAARLAETVPATQRTGIVHGDYRLDNCLLDPGQPGRIRAVLDWEMSTLGDPLADLGDGEPAGLQVLGHRPREALLAGGVEHPDGHRAGRQRRRRPGGRGAGRLPRRLAHAVLVQHVPPHAEGGDGEDEQEDERRQGTASAAGAHRRTIRGAHAHAVPSSPNRSAGV